MNFRLGFLPRQIVLTIGPGKQVYACLDFWNLGERKETEREIFLSSPKGS